MSALETSNVDRAQGAHSGHGLAKSGYRAKLGRAAPLARRLLLPVALIAGWIFVSAAHLVDPIFLPSPADLWDSTKSLSPLLPESLVASLTMTLSGFLGGAAFGLLLGLAMAYSRIVRDIFGDVLDFLRPVPIFALIPLFILWFGLGQGPQIAMIVLGTSLVIGVTTIEAIKNVPPVFIRAALVLGADRWTIYKSIILPSITPHLLGAIRVAAAASWGLDVAAEYIGAQVGLGHLMIVRVQYLDTAGVIVVVIIYCMLAVVLDRAIVILERPLTRWSDRNIRRGVVASVVGAG
jgi:ABC-type nitrate/sulfonate/bicarbonate transport system permease component